MNKKNLLYLVLTICLPLLYTSLASNSGGKTGKSTTSCVTCHGGINTATMVTITGNIPSTGFVANQTYNMTVTVQNTSYAGSPNRSGYNLSVNQGALIAGSGSSLLAGELTQSTPITNSATGSASWNFDWTAPAAATSVTFSAAGNATNGNFGSGGDAHNTGTATFSAASSVSAPTITSVAATGITDVAATVGAMVNANGASTAVIVEYGLTNAYGSNQVVTPNPVLGTAATSVTGNLVGLTPNTTYHYRVSGTNTSGTTNSPDGTFTTNFASAVKDINELKCQTYPNPVSELLEVKLDEEIVNSNLKLYTLDGKEVIANINEVDTRTIQINVSKLAKGVYVLKMNINGKSLSQQIVVK